MIFESERLIINSFIKDGDTICDVGANIGGWSNEVLSRFNDIKLYVFEPNFELNNSLYKLESVNTTNKVIIQNIALSDEQGIKNFNIYETSALSGFYRRPIQTEIDHEMKLIKNIEVNVNRLDNIINENISFIKIDVEGEELNVIKGCNKLINNNLIETIQFETGQTHLENNIKLEFFFNLLKDFPYIYKIFEHSNIIEKIEKYDEKLETYEYCNYIFSKKEYK
jgi:FkbM family methyltransferase